MPTSGPIAAPPAPAVGSGDGPRILMENWRVILVRSASNWTAVIVGALVGALSNTYLAAFAVIGFLPSPVLQLPLACLVGAIVIGGPIVLARLTNQPKMAAKVEEVKETKNAAN